MEFKRSNSKILTAIRLWNAAMIKDQFATEIVPISVVLVDGRKTLQFVFCLVIKPFSKFLYAEQK